MTIMSFISNHILLVGIVLVALFLIIRYLYTSGYFKKIGLDFDSEEFKKQFEPLQQLGNGEEFFNGTLIEEDNNDFFKDLDLKGGNNGLETKKGRKSAGNKKGN